MAKKQEPDISQEKIQQIEKMCQKLLREDGIRFVGFIDKMGGLIAGGLNEEVKPILDSEESRSHYMKQMLEITMKKDYDNTLGPIEHIITKRKNVQIITIPVNENLVLITTEYGIEPNRVLRHAKDTFQNIM